MKEVKQVTIDIPYPDKTGGSTRSVTITEDEYSMQDETLLAYLAENPEHDDKLPEGILAGVKARRAPVEEPVDAPVEEAAEEPKKKKKSRFSEE